jgi:protein-tyrosine phosphatase
MGNICRSPVVAEIARAEFKRAGVRIEIASAATENYHVGSGADARSIASAKAHGYDLSTHRARQVEAADFSRFDAVLAMDRINLETLRQRCPRDHAAHLGLFLAHAGLGSSMEVPDPYYGAPEDFDRVVALAHSGVQGLLKRHADGA